MPSMGSRLEKNSKDMRKRIAQHTFDDEDGEEYSASKFGGFSDYMRRKKIKLQNLDAEMRSQTTNNPQIFRNIVAHVNGYTQPSLSDLHKLIVSHGGGFLQYLDGKTAVTHVIASSLTPKKKVDFAKYRIVKPAWIVESVEAGRLLPWENYRVVDEGVTQKVLGFESGQMISQVNNQRTGYRDQTDSSWYTSQVKGVADKLNPQSASRGETYESEDQPSHDSDQSPANKDSIFEESPLYKNGALGSELLEGPSDGRDPMQNPQDTNTPQNSDDRNGDPTNIPADTLTTPEKGELTAEQHNAILLQNPHMAKSSTANPDFLNQYYQESRLHHLSTWKAELKAQLQARAQESSSQRSKPKRASGARRYVMHVDFDSFFAAVSLRKNPQLRDKPVVVAHGSGPGSEIASCNYPARKYGVKNGMWMKTALGLCPGLKVLPYDYGAYEEASKLFYDSILAIPGIVQSISIDEALIDVSELCIQAGGTDGKTPSEVAVSREQAKAMELALSLRGAIREKTDCEVSVGIGGNILLAKVALRKAKPAGQYLIKPEDVLDVLADLTVSDLPGFAYSISNKLEEIGVKYVKDIRALTKEKLINTLGPKTGEKIFEYSRGIDKQEVGEQIVRKSVSAEISWGIRFINQQQAEEFVYSLCEELSKRLLEQLVKGKQLTMKIMRKAADADLDPLKHLGHGKCDTFNKSVVLGVATNDKTTLGREAVSILRGYGFPPGELRGLGVQMQKLEPLKPSTGGAAAPADSSQRRLQFKKPDIQPQVKTPTRYSSPMNSTSVKKSPFHPGEQSLIHSSASKAKRSIEPIEEVPSPEKMRSLVAQSELSLLGDEQNTPLNISGTQFMLPTQIDPAVLAELPPDIRSKLAPKTAKLIETDSKTGLVKRNSKSRSASPFVSDYETELPSESQLDPEILAALPDDVREELLAEYRAGHRANTNGNIQRLLPQSPRKARPIATKKINTTPKKKHKISSLLGKNRSKVAGTSMPTLTQSNFVSMKRDSPTPDDSLISGQEIPLDFLEELPADIRLEILAEQKRQRMKQKSGLNLGNNRRRKKGDHTTDTSRGQQKLQLPEKNPKPTFTSRKLSELPDLREAVSSWVQTFSGDGEEGPYQEDTDALAAYLNRVVIDEGDMAKAQAVIEWLVYVVGDWPFADEKVRNAWQETTVKLKKAVQDAVQERGLAPLCFGG